MSWDEFRNVLGLLIFGALVAFTFNMNLIGIQLLPDNVIFYLMLLFSISLCIFIGLINSLIIKIGYVTMSFISFIYLGLLWSIIPSIVGFMIIELSGLLPYELKIDANNINFKNTNKKIDKTQFDRIITMGSILIAFIIFIGLNRAYLDYYINSNVDMNDQILLTNNQTIKINVYFRNRGSYDCPTTFILNTKNATMKYDLVGSNYAFSEGNKTLKLYMRMTKNQESYSIYTVDVVPDSKFSSLIIQIKVEPYTATDPITYIFRYLAETVPLGPTSIRFTNNGDSTFTRVKP